MRILFLDLDGTVRYSNHESGFINKSEDIEVYPEAKREVQRFLDAGWDIWYVSNQGGIAAGFTTQADFIEGAYTTNEKLGLNAASISAMYCPHAVDYGCFCRKPRPGMVTAIINFNYSLDIRVSDCLFVGDRPEDEGCAKACGIPFMWAEDWRDGKAKTE